MEKELTGKYIQKIWLPKNASVMIRHYNRNYPGLIKSDTVAVSQDLFTTVQTGTPDFKEGKRLAYPNFLSKLTKILNCDYSDITFNTKSMIILSITRVKDEEKPKQVEQLSLFSDLD